jgi:Uma2 family endonuclease
MATERGRRPVDYPESDGRPMAETGIHVEELIRVLQIVQEAFAHREDVYVFGNMMFYYEEGNPRAAISPDVCVVFGVPKLPLRRVFKLWEEAPPAAVFEITSRSTRREDLVKKRALYARIGVGEYYLYDPLAEYLRPALQGYRLESGEYRAIALEADGALVSDELGLRLLLMDGRLELIDPATGQRLLSPPERATAEARRATAEARRAAAEAQRAAAEAQRAAAAEARIAELEALLRERGGS